MARRKTKSEAVAARAEALADLDAMLPEVVATMRELLNDNDSRIRLGAAKLGAEWCIGRRHRENPFALPDEWADAPPKKQLEMAKKKQAEVVAIVDYLTKKAG